MKSLFQIACFLTFLLALPLQELSAAIYKAPNTRAGVFDPSSLSLEKLMKKRVASLLGSHVRSQSALREQKLMDLYSVTLGVALHLDPKNRTSTAAHQAYLKGEAPEPLSYYKYNNSEFAKEIMKHAHHLMSQDGSDDKALAGYLSYIAKEFDPSNEGAIEMHKAYTLENELPLAWAKGKGASESTPKITFGGQGSGKSSSKKEVAKKETKKKEKKKLDASISPFTKKISSIKGLVVMTMRTGEHLGQVLDIILSAQDVKDEKEATIDFEREVGEQMNTAFDEAKRYIKIDYPFWEPKKCRISFGDKYVKKDGGSAGAAFAILMKSMFEDFSISDKVGITGDITVDGKLREVGGVGAKIRGGQLDGLDYIIIPSVNKDEINDMVILNSASTLWKVQIFSASNINDAIEIAKDKKDSNIARAISIFSHFKDERNSSKFYKQAAIKEKLREVVRLCPNHLSAQNLLLLADNKMPKKLSAGTSIEQIFKELLHFREYFTDKEEIPAVSLEKSKEVEKKLKKIKSTINTKVNKLYTAAYNLVTTNSKRQSHYKNQPPATSSRYRSWKKKRSRYTDDLNKHISSVMNELEKIQLDKSMMEELIRE